jgi:hypothetical protein
MAQGNVERIDRLLVNRKETLMIYNPNNSQLSKTVYFRVNINGNMQLVPMEVDAQGLLKYIGRDAGESHSNIDS